MILDTALWHETPQISCLQWRDPLGPTENISMKPFFPLLVPFFLWVNFLTIYIFACVSIPCRKCGLCYKKGERLVKRPASSVSAQPVSRVGGGAAPTRGDRDHHGGGCGKPGTSGPTRQHREALEGSCRLPAGEVRWVRAGCPSRSPELGMLWAVALRDVDLPSHLCCTLQKDTMNSQMNTNRRFIF